MANSLSNERFKDLEQLQKVADDELLLKKGSKGDGVLAVQEALRDMAFNLQRYEMNGRMRGGPDGSFGPQTQTALKNFQAHAARLLPGISADGVLGPKSLAALDRLAPAPGLRAEAVTYEGAHPGSVWEGESSVRVVIVKAEHRTWLFSPDGAVQAI